MLRLYEFDQGTEITLCSRTPRSRYEFSSVILKIFPEQGRIILAPVDVNGKTVHFSHSGIEHTITITNKTKVYEYANVKLKEIRTKSKKYRYALSVECEDDVNPVNRRNFFRVFLGVEGTLETGVTRRSQEVIIKDISANGLGVICPKQVNFPTGTDVQVTFLDEMTGESFDLGCTIVRKVKNDENTVVYGCQLPEVSDSMEKFVALRQRIAKNSGDTH